MGPQPTATVKKKKRYFEFVETTNDDWKAITETINTQKLGKIWGELTSGQRRDLLKKLELDIELASLDFDELTDEDIKSLTSLDKSQFSDALIAVLGTSLALLSLTILDAPVDKPVSDIKDEPVPDRINIKVTDRQPSFNHPSSFVGEVNYFPEDLSMEVILNGKLYAFCNVSERLFDSFEGAGSKGAFFNREIKTLHDC